MRPQIYLWHRCDNNSNGQLVKVDPITGDAWVYSTFEGGGWYWFPTYKSCCHFYESETSTVELEFCKTTPTLILDKGKRRRVNRIATALAKCWNNKPQSKRGYILTIELLQRFVNAYYSKWQRVHKSMHKLP